MTNEGEGVMPKSRSNACDVSGKSANVIIRDGERAITAAKTTLVRDRYLESGFDQGVDLMTPQIPALRPSMQQNNKRPLALDHGA